MNTTFRVSSVLFLLAAAGGLLSQGPRKVTDAEVRRVHDSAILIDTHNDVTSETVKGLDLGVRRQKGHTDIPRLKEGGVDAVFFAVYVAAKYAGEKQAAHRTLEMIDTVRHDIVAKHANDVMLITTADGIEAAHRAGKIAALMGIEGGHAIEDSLRLLRQYYNLGVRYMTLTHVNSNNWVDSSGDKPRNNGLNDLGRQVIAEMNRLGMMVDVSHISDKAFEDVLAVSKAPVIASHSSCRALSLIGRNMSDQMIVALAKKGGVIQINFGCEFLSQKSADTSPWSNPRIAAKAKQSAAGITDKKKRAAAQKAAEEQATAKMVRATLADVVAHIDHVVKIAGIGAVGIGTDFDGVECTPVGLDDASKFPNLTRALLEKGYTAEQIQQIYGGNLLRVMRAVERARGK